MAIDPLGAMRDIALSFPEAVEQETWGHPTFRVRKKIFVSMGTDDNGVAVATMKAAPGEQDSLLAEGHPFFLPSYVGSKGWIGIVLDADTNWTAVGELVVDSYVQIAPKSLANGIAVNANPDSKLKVAMLKVGDIIGELVEGKPPKDQNVAVSEFEDDHDDGLKLRFDPDDPGSTTIDL